MTNQGNLLDCITILVTESIVCIGEWAASKLAILRSLDVDQARNLAKSVTVE